MAFTAGQTVCYAGVERGMGPRPRTRGVVTVAAAPNYTILWEDGFYTASTIASAAAPNSALDLVGVAAAADLALRDKVVRITTNSDGSQEAIGLVVDVYTRSNDGTGAAATFATVALLPGKTTYVEVPIAQVSEITSR